MAGAGYKLFATGDILTAAQVNTYLMQQTTMVFADSAARTSALSGVVSEGMLTYLLDTNSLEYYDGAAFQPVSSPGDITAVTAGTGISGGGTSGAVTITNSMATAITTNGDTLYGTGSGTFSRLGIGSTGQVLTVAAGIPSWASPTTGSITLITSTSMTGVASITFASIPSTYKDLVVMIKDAYQGTNGMDLKMELNGDTTAGNYNNTYTAGRGGSSSTTQQNNNSLQDFGNSSTAADNYFYLYIPDYTNTTSNKQCQLHANFLSDNGNLATQYGTWSRNNTAAITQIVIAQTVAGNFSAGTCQLYGVN